MADIQLPDDMAAYGGILMDTRPWLYADAAADALRRLHHCTDETDVEGWETPADGYRVVGHLVTLMQRIPDLLADVEYLIAGHDQAIEAAGAADTPTELRALYAEIRGAQTAARETIAALGRVHAQLGRIKSKSKQG
ncbi:hypothetical protein [Streptomyces sp. NPDC088746]|uniref:hypothetical protein n=1 Tax=Streptomyces sp. NPDC088746 TaxID=3365885 RepID=UPI0037FB2448